MLECLEQIQAKIDSFTQKGNFPRGRKGYLNIWTYRNMLHQVKIKSSSGHGLHVVQKLTANLLLPLNYSGVCITQPGTFLNLLTLVIFARLQYFPCNFCRYSTISETEHEIIFTENRAIGTVESLWTASIDGSAAFSLPYWTNQFPSQTQSSEFNCHTLRIKCDFLKSLEHVFIILNRGKGGWLQIKSFSFLETLWLSKIISVCSKNKPRSLVNI